MVWVARGRGWQLIDPNLFKGRLLPGERIVWSGRPVSGLIFTSRDVFLVPFSLAWCGFAVFWEYSVLGTGARDFSVLWGAMFVCVGLYFVAGRFLVDGWVRKGASYAVTNQRVLIARSSPFSKFISINLAQLADTELSERSNGRGSIRFGQTSSIWGRQNMGMWTPSLDATPQFLMIDDARKVFDLLQREVARS